MSIKKLHIPVLLVSCIYFSCNTQEQKASAQDTDAKEDVIALTKEQSNNLNIVLKKPEIVNLEETFTVSGKVDVPPQNMVTISIPLGGYLTNTKLLPGMHVQKGEIIATVQDQQYIQLQQDYLQEKIKLSTLKLEWARQKELNKTKSTSDKLLQIAEQEYKQAEVSIHALQEKLKLIALNPDKIDVKHISKSISLYAPIDGYVTKVNANIGKYISPAEVLFELVNPEDIHLALKVYESDMSKLAVGQKLLSYTVNNPSVKHKCEVILIGKQLTNERSTEVHCHFLDYDKTLIPGTFMNADILNEVKNALTVDKDAIVNYQGKQYIVLQQSQNKYKLQGVVVGASNKQSIQIISPDITKETYVSKGAYYVLMAIKNKAED